jgi:hypothetical protein
MRGRGGRVRSPLMELLREVSVPTLDDWLSAAGCDNEFDGEIEVPEDFEEEYLERCRMNCDERKFEEQRRHIRP